MLIFFYAISIIFLLFLLGIGLANLLIPFEKFSIWLIPWVSIVFLIVFLVIFSFLGFPLKFVSYPLILLLTLLTIWSFSKIKKIQINIVEDSIILFFIFLSLFILLYPLVKLFNFPTTISLGNNDVVGYAEAADYLVLNSLNSAFVNKISFGVDNILLGAFRWGGTILMSFFLSIFSLKGFQLTYIIHVVIFVLSLPLNYLILKKLYKRTIPGLIMLLGISAFNVNFVYMIFHNFFPIAIFRGVFCFLFLFLLHYFHDKKIKKTNFHYSLIISLSLSALYFSYQEVVLFTIAPLGIYLIYLFFKNKTDLKDYSRKITDIGTITLLISFTSIIYSIRFLFRIFHIFKGQPIGWQLFRSSIPYANPFEMLGFYSIHAYEPMPLFFAVFFSLLTVFFIARGIIIAKTRIFYSVFVLFYIFLLIRMSFLAPNFFDYNRIVVYFLPFFMVPFVIGMVDVLDDLKVKGIFTKVFLLIFLIFLELMFTRKLISRLYVENIAVDQKYISLQNIQNKKSIFKKPILLENSINTSLPYWNLVWLQYFLNLNNPPIIISESKKINDGDLILTSKNSREFDLYIKKTIWENDFYRIGSLCQTDSCLIKENKDFSKIRIGKGFYEDSLLLSGWSVKDGESRWTNSDKVTLRLITKKKSVKFSVIALSLKEPQIISLYIDDVLIGSQPVKNSWSKAVFYFDELLEPGLYRIDMKFSNSYKPSEVIPGSVDSRDLYVNFKEISLE